MAKKKNELRLEQISFIAIKADRTPTIVTIKVSGPSIVMTTADGDNIVWGT